MSALEQHCPPKERMGKDVVDVWKASAGKVVRDPPETPESKPTKVSPGLAQRKQSPLSSNHLFGRKI